MNLNFKNNVGQTSSTLRIGVDANATNGIDSQFNEFELPYGFQPMPGQFETYLEWENSVDYDPPQMMWTYVNIQELPDEKVFTKDYLVKSWNGYGDTIIVSWNLNPQFIEKATLSYFNVSAAQSFEFDMLEQDSAIVGNILFLPGLRINISVDFNFEKNSVLEKNTDKVYLDHNTNNLHINTFYSRINIYDVFGRILHSVEPNKTLFSMRNFHSGIYFIEINTDNNVFVKKIVLNN